MKTIEPGTGRSALAILAQTLPLPVFILREPPLPTKEKKGTGYARNEYDYRTKAFGEAV